MEEKILIIMAIIRVALTLLICCGIILFIWFSWQLAIRIEVSLLILLIIATLSNRLLEKYLDDQPLSTGNPDKDKTGT